MRDYKYDKNETETHDDICKHTDRDKDKLQDQDR